MQSVFFKTLGCKVNTYDTHALANQFRRRGYRVVDDIDTADIAVMNTCSVTQNADREARYFARRIKRTNPDTVLVATGCYAQTDSAKLADMDEIDLVIPNEAKEQLFDMVTQKITHQATGKLPENYKAVSANKQSHFKSSLTLFDQAHSAQTRTFVKVQDGCNGFCSYCLIPYARGASRSVPMSDVLHEIERLVALGTKEVVITGIHVGDYESIESHNQVHRFADLMDQMMLIDGLERVRISSLEPSEATPELMEVLARHQHKVCDHFHLPLQSGSDPILKAMRRTYDSQAYAKAVERIRQVFPQACIGADIIPGFPGETAVHFEETLAFIQAQQLSYLHVFPYSKRPNTAAARMPGHLDPTTVKERARQLRALGANLKKDYLRQFVGKEMLVLWEEKQNERGQRYGLTPNYIKVLSTGSSPLKGDIQNCKLHGFTEPATLLAAALP